MQAAGAGAPIRPICPVVILGLESQRWRNGMVALFCTRIPLSAHWVRNGRVSWGCNYVSCLVEMARYLHWKYWEVPCLVEPNATQWPKTFNIPYTVWDEEGQEYECCLLPDLQIEENDANMMLHIMRAHLYIMLWKAADQREPICRDKRQINVSGRLLKEGLSCPLFPPRQW